MSEQLNCIINAFKTVQKFTRRLKAVVNVSAVLNLLRAIIFLVIFTIGFSSRLFAVINYESIIHEFDPW